ncbi:MAG: hypothetical protein HY707_14940 [Ignavibacteriae bacterium]|nr:hypothetical protein [Ignavibacteriota bacterium]
MMNSALRRYLSLLEVWYDRDHYRFFFPVRQKDYERIVLYRSLNRKRTRRKVVWRPKRRSTGEAKNFWWHIAAGLRFHQMANLEWCLSIRPERHITTDGVNPLPSEQIGRRVTRLKARMYNDLYLKEVNFWKEYLAQGKPRIILDFGNQSAILAAKLITVSIKWPGIPNDNKPFRNDVSEEDLFTSAELAEAMEGEAIDWDELEEEVIEDEE